MRNVLTLQEACTELDIDQSTLYRWMIRAHIESTYDSVDHRKRVLTRSQVNELARIHGCVLYGTSDSEALQLLSDRLETVEGILNRASVEAVTARKESETYPTLTERIKASETNYSVLSDRLRVIEDRLCMIESLLQERPATLKPARPGYAVSDTPSDIPTGSRLYSDFAKLHSVPASTFKGHITGGHVPCIERAKPGRPNEQERWLTPGHQHAAVQFWTAHGTVFSECDACPHDIEH